ncbi:GNAT family N-acetyltransferase [Psychroserpens sp. XS_ASV72]|uniref:GNAT family N-acetyltransferase n=1 Tax=Psychroserpens sp. XS_ASV72 TaxID=3241293 RepID=UPI00351494C5
MILETNRLILSKIEMEDAEFFLELLNTPDRIKYIGDRNVRTIEDARTYIKDRVLEQYKTQGFGYYKIQLKSDRLKPIGTCGLLRRDELEHPDIGFTLLPEYYRKGYAYEAVKALLQFLKTDFKILKVYAITLEENIASIALLKKLGLSFQKTVKPFEDDEELLLFAKDL